MKITPFHFSTVVSFFAVNKLSHYLVVLWVFTFISCRSNSIPTFESFNDSSVTTIPEEVGTLRIWQELLEDVTSANQPRALLLDHGE